jgi:hypothetical protein
VKTAVCRYCRKTIVRGENDISPSWADLDRPGAIWKCLERHGPDDTHVPALLSVTRISSPRAPESSQDDAPKALNRGDQILVRATVHDAIHSSSYIKVRIQGEEGFRDIHRKAVETVLPAEQRRTKKGFTVAQTRAAIADFKERAKDDEAFLADNLIGNEATELGIACVRGVIKDLEQQLREINVEP